VLGIAGFGGMYKVGIVGWSADDECEGGRGSLVTGWERMGGEGESWGKTGWQGAE
jgi:hypothetical protein